MELQQRLRELENQKSMLFESGSADQTEVGRINAEIRAIEAQIQQQEERNAQAAERIEEGRKAANSVLDNVDGIPLESLAVSSDAAIMIRSKVTAMVNGLTTRHNNEILGIINENEGEIDKRDQEIDQLRRELSDCTKTIERMQQDNLALSTNLEAETNLRTKAEFERDEAFKVRDNAAKQLLEFEDLKEEYEKVKEENERLKLEQVETEEDRTEEAEAARQRFLESRIKVTNVRWENEFIKTNYLAERADTGETIRYGYLEHGKYLEVTAEEAESFRLAYELAHTQADETDIPALADEVEPPAMEGPEEPTFQESEPVPSVQQGNEPEDCGNDQPALGTDAETFEQWATREINELKRVVYGKIEQEAA